MTVEMAAERPANEFENGLHGGWFSGSSVSDNSESMMLGSVKKGPEHFQALERVKEWTRERFELSPEAAILVSELTCVVPGCPPLETVVAFWTADEKRHHFKLFKPVAEVVNDDLPLAWLIDALIVPEGIGCECC